MPQEGGIGRRRNPKYCLRDVLPCCFGNSDGKRGFGRKAGPSRALRKSVYVYPHKVYMFVYECVNLSSNRFRVLRGVQRQWYFEMMNTSTCLLAKASMHRK